jgi:hypothetical protein
MYHQIARLYSSQGAIMATDLARFPFPSLSNLQASTITEALAHEAAGGGFVFLTFQARQPEAFVENMREFAHNLRCNSPVARLTDIKAFRQVRREEAGGAMPYDQAICDQLFQQAPPIQTIVLNNPAANWLILLDTDSPESALALAETLDTGENGMKALAEASSQHSIGAFRNARQYARVSYDPDVVQFFNLFPGPNNLDVMWKAWTESLPWFFEYTELRSSFPLRFAQALHS